MSAETSSTLQLYRRRVPAHEHIAADVITDFLTEQVTLQSPVAWGDRFQLAVVYLAAHEIEMTPGYGSYGVQEVGQITMQRDGDLQRQYAQPMTQGARGVDDWLNLTTYGKRVLALRAQTVGALPTVLIAGDARREAELRFNSSDGLTS